MPPTDDIVSLADIEAAAERIEGVVHRTRLDPSNTFASMTDADEVHLKLENMQRTGAYKIRGAYNTISQLPEETTRNGVIASSAGNHAQGVALAAQLLGVDATIVMPEVTPAAKIEATRGYGAEVVIHGEIYEQAYKHALELEAERELAFVHPFNDPDIIAGQGTIGLEMYEDCPTVDTVLVAIGGGGLISGIATALKANNEDIRVIGVQTEGTAHAKRTMEGDEIYEREEIDTITEGIAASRMEENTAAIVRELVDDVVEVDDAAVTEALALLTERANTVSESAGAVPTAALLDGTVDVTGETVISLISGGNIDLTELGELTRTGLMHLDRYVRVRLALSNWPVALGSVGEVIKDAGAKLDDIQQEPLSPAAKENRHLVTAGIEGVDRAHLDDVIAALEAHENVELVDELD
jgi:threonine dehydratase